MNGEFDRLADIQLLWIARGEFQHHPGANVNYRTDTLAYANACHAADVEVDIDTLEIKILSYIALQDSGVLINPMMLDGQVHGGVPTEFATRCLNGWVMMREPSRSRQSSPTTFCRRRPKCL
jgi:hypothetical protein